MNPEFYKIIDSGSASLYIAAVYAALFLGGRLITADSAAWPLPQATRIRIIAAVMIGSLVGCALPAYLAEGEVGWLAWHHVVGPKTILGGIFGGFLGAALYKKCARISYDTSDAFARGACLMMAVGRLGCIAQHCCFGIPVAPGYGWDFGDGVPRFPAQTVEAIFLFALFFALHFLHRRNLFQNQRLFILFLCYGLARFSLEFFREQIAGRHGGLGFYQWLALLVAGTGLWQILKRRRAFSLETNPHDIAETS